MLFVGSASALFASEVKVHITKDGFYRVSGSDLAPLFGVQETELAAMSLAVFNLGQPVASVRDGADVIFYGHRFENIYTDENVYWVRVGTPVLPEVITLGAGQSPFAPSFSAKVREERQLIARADLIRGSEYLGEDPLLWRLFTSGLASRQYNAPFPMTMVAPNTGGTLTVRLKGATDTANRYYHAASITLNGTLLGTIHFEGLESKAETFTVPAGLWSSGNNTVRILSTPPAGTSFDSFYLDYIEADYQRLHTVEHGQLSLVAAGSSIKVDGLTGTDVMVWDVTDRWAIQSHAGASVIPDGSLWSVTFAAIPERHYAVLQKGSEYAPSRLVSPVYRNLRDLSREVDHLTIACGDLYDAAQHLTDYRSSMGLEAELICANSIYDEFNFGIRDARAIKNFLAYTYHHWALAPRYVVLVGDGSFDYKDELGFGDSRIPAFPVVWFYGMYVTDAPYGDIFNDGFPRMAVGRIPVNSAASVSNYIAKLIEYEVGGVWRDNTLISTDLSDFAGNYLEEGNLLQQIITDRTVVRADMDLIGAEMTREQMLDGINAGKEVAVYIGHGTPNALSLQSILVTADTASMTNRSAPTAFFGLGCLIGTFGNPGLTSIGEGFIEAQGGASAMIAAATLISVVDGRVMIETMLDELYQNNRDRMGDAWLAGQAKLSEFGLFPAFNGFQLLGDPAMAVGSASSPRLGAPSPVMGSYEEWVEMTFPPSLFDHGMLPDPDEDSDGDGLSNYQEYLAGTDPLNVHSSLQVVELKRLVNGQVAFEWPSVAQRTYRLEWSSSIGGPYHVLADDIPATAPVNQLIPTGLPPQARFFRVAIP